LDADEKRMGGVFDCLHHTGLVAGAGVEPVAEAIHRLLVQAVHEDVVVIEDPMQAGAAFDLYPLARENGIDVSFFTVEVVETTME